MQRNNRCTECRERKGYQNRTVLTVAKPYQKSFSERGWNPGFLMRGNAVFGSRDQSPTSFFRKHDTSHAQTFTAGQDDASSRSFQEKCPICETVLSLSSSSLNRPLKVIANTA